MSHELKKCIHILTLISKIKSPRLRNIILEDISCDDDIFSALSEIAHNYVKGNIPLQNNCKQKVDRKYSVLKKLAKTSKKSKKILKQKIVNQVGSAWPLLIPAVIELLSLIKK